MNRHYRWETSLAARREADPGIDAPERRKAAQAREETVLGGRLAELSQERSLTEQEPGIGDGDGHGDR